MITKKKRRLFFTILPDKKALGLIDELRKKYPDIENLKWVKTENLHITILFLGNVEDQQLPLLIKAAEDVLNNQSSFELTVDELILKPSPSRPAMIWLQYQQSPEFTYVHNRLKKASVEFAKIEETRNQIPHITLARVKNKQVVPLYKIDEVSIITVNKIELWESFTRPEGSVYVKIKPFNLK